jgi:hypothetical protein
LRFIFTKVNYIPFSSAVLRGKRGWRRDFLPPVEPSVASACWAGFYFSIFGGGGGGTTFGITGDLGGGLYPLFRSFSFGCDGGNDVDFIAGFSVIFFSL